MMIFILTEFKVLILIIMITQATGCQKYKEVQTQTHGGDDYHYHGDQYDDVDDVDDDPDNHHVHHDYHEDHLGSWTSKVRRGPNSINLAEPFMASSSIA